MTGRGREQKFLCWGGSCDRTIVATTAQEAARKYLAAEPADSDVEVDRVFTEAENGKLAFIWPEDLI